MEDKNKGLSMRLSITGTEKFKTILGVLGKIVTDERIDEDIRVEYFKEILENIGD